MTGAPAAASPAPGRPKPGEAPLGGRRRYVVDGGSSPAAFNITQHSTAECINQPIVWSGTGATYTTGFIDTFGESWSRWGNNTFTGSFTGPRARVASKAMLQVDNGSLTYFPGTSPVTGDGTGAYGSPTAAVAIGWVDAVAGFIKAPANQTYRIVEDVPFGCTLTEFTAKLAAGTLTAQLTINGTNVTNGSINGTTTQGSASPTAANVAAANGRIELVVTSISAPADLSFTVKYARS